VPLALISIRSKKKKPFMLLTNVLTGTLEDIVTVALEYYAKRWKIEETFRHCKHVYGIEKVNVRKLQRLKNIISLFMAAMFCLYVCMGRYLREWE
jgi:transposase